MTNIAEAIGLLYVLLFELEGTVSEYSELEQEPTPAQSQAISEIKTKLSEVVSSL